MTRSPFFCRAVDDYIETHTHGRISLRSDADALLLDPSFRGSPTATALLEAAERYGLSVRWHQGSQLRLAARVIVEHAEGAACLTAAAIGRAARMFLREPRSWREWGAPDPSLTVFKDLWRVLVVHGAPEPAAAEP